MKGCTVACVRPGGPPYALLLSLSREIAIYSA